MRGAGLPGLRSCKLAAVLVVVAGMFATSPAGATPDEPAPTADDATRARASEVFEAARRLFEAGDFAAAARTFEEAYDLAPHHAAAWNAARSWHKAGELPRAATLYQRYLREAPWDAPDRDAAGRSLAELRQVLGRIEVQPPGVTGVTVDGRQPEYDEVWVVPGSHIVESVSGAIHRREGHGRHSRYPGPSRVIKVDVEAGASASVAIVPEGDPPVPEPPAAARPRDASNGGGEGGWPAWSVLPFAGATLIGAGGLVASGIDTENLHEEFEASGKTSAYAFDNGKFAMNRTNVLVAVTAGLGAVTLGVALFAIDWNGEAEGGRVVGIATPRGLDARTSF